MGGGTWQALIFAGIFLASVFGLYWMAYGYQDDKQDGDLAATAFGAHERSEVAETPRGSWRISKLLQGTYCPADSCLGRTRSCDVICLLDLFHRFPLVFHSFQSSSGAFDRAATRSLGCSTLP